jgi:acyl-coenzyme A thioesterase PaaI-like protein
MPCTQSATRTVASVSTEPVTAAAISAMIAKEFSGTGNTCFEVGDGYAIARRDVQPDEIRPGGFVSGPTQFGLADAALWYVTFVGTGRIEPMAMTSELSIRYIRPAVGDVLWARATLDVAGRRSVVGTVSIWTTDESKPSAVAQGTYMLPHTPST